MTYEYFGQEEGLDWYGGFCSKVKSLMKSPEKKVMIKLA